MTTLTQSDLDDLRRKAFEDYCVHLTQWKFLALLDHIAQLTAERDEARKYGSEARMRENEAEQARVSLSFEVTKRDARIAELEAHASAQPYQARVDEWMHACFSSEICADVMERNHRFFEEAAELVQSLGMTASEAHQLVDYTWGRDIGEPEQEVGGVKVTLAALCLAANIDMKAAAEAELARVWTKIETIRAKQAAKPKHSPLPQTAHPSAQFVDLVFENGPCPEGARFVEAENPEGKSIRIGEWIAPKEGEKYWRLRLPMSSSAQFAAVMRRAADIARNACLVPPDGGEPTEDEARMCNLCAAAILAEAALKGKDQ